MTKDIVIALIFGNSKCFRNYELGTMNEDQIYISYESQYCRGILKEILVDNLKVILVSKSL